MHIVTLSKSMGLAATVFAAAITAAHADSTIQTGAPSVSQQVAETVVPSVSLPPVEVVRPRPQPSWYYDPYVTGRGQKASSLEHIPYQHFTVPVGYDKDVTMHPYTSLIGPCPEGASPSQGCRHDTGKPITPSHYERAPFNQ